MAGECFQWLFTIATDFERMNIPDPLAFYEAHKANTGSIYKSFDAFIEKADKASMLTEKQCDKWKQDGNTKFKQKEYEAAIFHYTKALHEAPTAKLQATLMSNRATAFFHLQRYEIALLDCHRATQLDGSYKKAYYRRGCCLKELKLVKQGNADIEHSQAEGDNLREKDETVESLVLELEKAMEKENEWEDAMKKPEVQVHDSVLLKCDDTQGRYLSSKSVIERGTTLLSELPQTCALYREHTYTHCGFCLSRMAALIPSPYNQDEKDNFRKCSHMYCSNRCAKLHWETVGKVECQHVWWLVCPIDFLLASRLYLSQKFSSEYTFDTKIPNDLISKEATTQVLNPPVGYDHCLTFQGFSSEITEGVKVGGGETAVVVLALHCGVIDIIIRYVQDLGEDEIISDGLRQRCCSDLVSLMRSGLSNEIAITKLFSSKASGAMHSFQQSKVAKGVYNVLSMMNHSCVPNCHVSWVNGPYCCTRRVVVRATRPIQKGEQLMISYGPTKWNSRVKSTRIKALKEQYNFTCQCESCSSDDTSDQIYIPEDLQPRFKEANNIFQRGRLAMKEKRPQEAKQAYQQSLDILLEVEGRYQPPHIIAQTYDKIAESCAAQQDFKEALQYCELAVEWLVKVYGTDSMEIASEYDKLAMLAVKVKNKEKAMKYIEKAVPLLEAFYGPKHQGVKELLGWKKSILAANADLEAKRKAAEKDGK
eukprot:TRINITY_DN64478_c0_g1_i2.p1 TRINITY_DN64478_c0_g1~~TRINITY_DN64478_c0_g1_i2.p1  ORF type:complete len:730 (+),score=67.51 TRINITY_DN64478_c0_g1_i2:70-2190(+)